jgi:hypothetical protein
MSEDIRELQDATAWDSEGHKLGQVGQVHRDRESGRIAWITVTLGLLETKTRFVPMAGARVEGADVYVSYDGDTVKDSPDLDIHAEEGLTPEQEAELAAYYGL